MMKYNEGDLVTFKLTPTQAKNFNAIGIYSAHFNSADVHKHEPAPFDWANVEPGMAFKSIVGRVIWYVAKDFTDSDYAVFATDKVWMNFISGFYKDTTRAPEHDIVVQP